MNVDYDREQLTLLSEVASDRRASLAQRVDCLRALKDGRFPAVTRFGAYAALETLSAESWRRIPR